MKTVLKWMACCVVAALCATILLCSISLVHGESIIYDFTQDGCPPCRAMEPVIQSLQADGVPVQKVHVSDPLARQLQVSSTPTFVLVSDGRPVARIVGATNKKGLSDLWMLRSGQPKSAWRYEKAEGSKAAAVRIICDTGNGQRALGSGVYVRWHGRPLIVTARHVIRGAKSVVVRLSTGKTIRCRVVVADPTWDCAALEPLDRIEGVEPAICEVGDAAILKAGDALETCGFGSNDKFAVNSGRVKGFTKATAAERGITDWMEVSGYVRQGDSGGPVFNASGKVVGILWGGNFGNPSMVICVQSGRMHRVLDDAAKKLGAYDQKDYRYVAQTPPAPSDGNSILPWRNEIDNRISDIANRPQQPIVVMPPQNQFPIGGQPSNDPSGQQALQGLSQLEGRVGKLEQDVAAIGKAVNGIGEEVLPDGKPDGMSRMQRRALSILEKLPGEGRIESNLKEGRGFLSIDDIIREKFSLPILIVLIVVFIILVKVWKRRHENNQSLLPIGDRIATGLQAASIAHPGLAPIATGVSAVHGFNERILDRLFDRAFGENAQPQQPAPQQPSATAQPK